MGPGIILLAGLGLAGAALLRRGSGSSAPSAPTGPDGQGLLRLPGWPLDPRAITRLGQDLGAQRVQHLHQGLDLFAPAGTDVVAPEALRIIRSVNGSRSESASAKRAGQWVDALGLETGLQLRFLHLAEDPPVKAGQQLARGAVIGQIAATGTSGLETAPPHLHFEVHEKPKPADVYGAVVNPLWVLPDVGITLIDQRLAAARSAAGGKALA